MPRHSLLARQLKRFFPGTRSFLKEWQEFLDAVDKAYHEADEDRSMLERSMELSSQELLQANSEMRAVVQAFPDIFFLLSSDGTILNYKGGSATDFYLPPQQLIGKRIQDVPFGNVGQRFDAAIQEVRQGKAIVSLEYLLKSPNRQDFYEARLVPVHENQILVIVRNISERKQAEAQLSQSEKKYRELVDSLPAIVWEGDPNNFRITYVSHQVQNMLGYSQEQWVHELTWQDLIHPEDLERVFAVCQKEVAAGRDHTLEFRLLAADGRVVWVRDETTVAVEQGRPIKLLGVLVDITERKRAEEQKDTLRIVSELFLSSETLESIYEELPKILSARFQFPQVAIELYDEVAGCMVFVATAGLPADFPKLLRVPLDQTISGTVAITGRAVVEAKASSRPEYRFAALKKLETETFLCVPMKSGERILGTLGLADSRERDIEPSVCETVQVIANYLAQAIERKRAEEALRESEERLRQTQKMEAIGKLAGGIAHDFNNILTAILGYGGQLLRRVPGNGHLRHPAEEICKAAERAAGLTRQLLAFSRRQVLQPKPLDLNAVVSNMVAMFERLIGEHITLVTMLDPAVGAIKADLVQLEQALVNLAVNARDAMPQGGTLTLETANVELDATAAGHLRCQPGAYARVIVRDTGCGMDADTQAHCFEPFFTTKPVGKGTGLGLATVYGIVQQSGGTIEIESAPRLGTTFRLYLPRAPHLEVVAPVPGNAALLEVGTETILLVEDEMILRELIRDVLQESGYVVLEASGVEDALRLGQQHAGLLHLLLTDVVMPGMSGRELAQQLVLSNPRMKVLYMSGYMDDAIVQHGILENGIPFLQKPFTPSVLERKVREVLTLSPAT